MPIETYQARVRLKSDTEENWNIIKDSFVPLNGELIVYTAPDVIKMKFGDGTTVLGSLPFVSQVFSNKKEVWDAVPSLVSSKNIIYVYLDAFNYTSSDGNEVVVPGVKIGDGSAYLIDLPFLSDDLREVIEKHIGDQTIHVTQNEKNAWNNKVSIIEPISDENLIFIK